MGCKLYSGIYMVDFLYIPVYTVINQQYPDMGVSEKKSLQFSVGNLL